MRFCGRILLKIIILTKGNEMINMAAIRWTLEVSRRSQLSEKPLNLKVQTQVQKYVVEVLEKYDSSILKDGPEKELCDLAITVGRLVAADHPSAYTLEKVKGFYIENFLETKRNPALSEGVTFIKEQVEAYAERHELSLDKECLFDLEMEDENFSVDSDAPPPPPPYSRSSSSSDSFSSRLPPSPFKPVMPTISQTSSESVSPVPMDSSRSVTPAINETVEGRNKRLAQNRAEINRVYTKLLRQNQGISPLAQLLQAAPAPVEEVRVEERRESIVSSNLSVDTASEDDFRMSL